MKCKSKLLNIIISAVILTFGLTVCRGDVSSKYQKKISNVEKTIQSAKASGAEVYALAEINSAEMYLKQAVNAKTEDEAKELLEKALDKANDAVKISKKRKKEIEANKKAAVSEQRKQKKEVEQKLTEAVEQSGMERKSVGKVKIVTADEVRKKQLQNKDFLLIDTRYKAEYEKKYIQGALCIPLIEIVYKKIPKDKEIVLYCSSKGCDSSSKVAEQLVGMGYENISVLKDGLAGWEAKGYPIVGDLPKPAAEQISGISVEELKKNLDAGEDMLILDVREYDEFRAGHLPGAVNVPMETLDEKIKDFSKDKMTIVYSRTGRRSYIASEKLNGNGFAKVRNLLGGIAIWGRKGYSVTVK